MARGAIPGVDQRPRAQGLWAGEFVLQAFWQRYPKIADVGELGAMRRHVARLFFLKPIELSDNISFVGGLGSYRAHGLAVPTESRSHHAASP